MKAPLTLLVLLTFTLPGFSQAVIDLNHQPATFTNLQGRVYQDVRLDRATLDGLIYSSTNGSTVGMVRYSDLSTNFLASLKIPADRIQIAAKRQAALAAQTKQYDEATRRLALKEQQDELANSNALSQAQATAPDDSASATNPTPTKPAHKKKRN